MLPNKKNNQPAAPAVYRPQSMPKVLQRKPSPQLLKGQPPSSMPPVSRPAPKKVVQTQPAAFTVNARGAGLKASGTAVQLMRRGPQPQDLTLFGMIQVKPPKVKKLQHGIEQFNGTIANTRTGKLVVLFGEATFDFAVQYAYRHPAYKIVATEYRDINELFKQKADAALKIIENISALKKMGVVVLFGVDATSQTHWQFITQTFGGGQQIEKAQWNDPHGSTYGEIEPETNLMTGFFNAASSSLPVGGKLKMTYAGWPYLAHPEKTGQVDLNTIANPSFNVGALKTVTRGKYDFNPQRTIGGNINDKLTYDQLSKQTFVKK